MGRLETTVVFAWMTDYRICISDVAVVANPVFFVCSASGDTGVHLNISLAVIASAGDAERGEATTYS